MLFFIILITSENTMSISATSAFNIAPACKEESP